MNPFLTSTVVSILEISSAFYPEKNGNFSHNDNFILPSQNTIVQFGGSQTSSATKIPILCGPSPFINTMNCFSMKLMGYTQSVPIPGEISSTPVFADNSWVIGTTKGFLFRTKTKSENDFLPSIDPQNTELWGSYSRQFMDDFVPKAIYKESNSAQVINANSEQQIIPKNYFWIFPTSSPFVGTPIIKHGFVYGLTTNQSLQAIDFKTGKLIWSAKISSNEPLSLENASLNVTDDIVLIGTNRGHLLVLDPFTGDQINDIVVSNISDRNNRFSSVIAPLLLVNHKEAIVSNINSVTQKLSLDTFKTIWTYPEGSVTAGLILNSSTVILTTSSGKIVSLNEQTGSSNWIVDLHKISPLVDSILTNDKKVLLVATKRGELIALDPVTGKILTERRAIGNVIGFFFQNPHHPNESCLSFSTGSFRCFIVKT